jgi:hypothetical protein
MPNQLYREWAKRASLYEWDVGNVVEVAPGLFGQILEVTTSDGYATFVYKPVMVTSRWTWWQRIKLSLGWRPDIGY